MNAPPSDETRARSVRRRHLTILFSDLCESTSLAGSMEPEHYLEMVDGIRDAASRVVAKHGGTVVELRGDGIVAMFGYPEADETDGRRAAEAALELHEAVSGAAVAPAGSAPDLRLHSGIHSGWVLLIESDSPVGRFSIIGEAPNVAARLSSAALRDEILVSAATLGPESHLFEVQQRGRLVLRGKSELVSTYRVVRKSRAISRFDGRTRQGLAPFVGRAPQLAVLDDVWTTVSAGEVKTAAIVAGPGVGKTRLAEEFLSRITASRACAVYRGHCDNSSGAEPLQPFLQWLRSLGGLDFDAPLAPSSTEVTPRPGRHEPPSPTYADLVARAWAATSSVGKESAAGATPRDNQASSALALRNLVEALARAKPAVLFIDDWQWADDATRQALGAIRQLTGLPLLVLLTSREPTTHDLTIADAELVELTPLDDDAAVEAVRALRPDADPFVVDRIRRLAGGTPLFIEELCHAATGFGILSAAGPEPDDFGWLNGLIESRVARLPAAHAEVLRVAAVIGTVLPAWLLEAMTGCDGSHQVVRELAERDFLYPGDTDDTLRFKHGITRDVIYASVGLRERQSLHLRIAEHIEQASRAGQDDAIELLAYHFGAAERPVQAAQYAEQAGDKAMSRAAADRARSHYTVALEALDRVAEPLESYQRWSAVVHRLGLACVFDPARDQLAHFRNAASRARQFGRLADLARAEYWLGFIHYGLGESHEAIAHYEASRAHCAEAAATSDTTPDPRLMRELDALDAQLLATLGQAHAAAADYDTALAQIDGALNVKRQHGGVRRPSVGLAYTLACKGSVLGDLGRFDEAHACFDEALGSITVGESPVEGSVLGWRSAVYVWQGRWDEARETAQRVQRTAQRTGSLYVLAMGLVVFNYAKWILSRDGTSIDAMIRAISWLEAREKRLSISMSYGWLAESLALAGREAEARSYASRALARARVDDRFGEAQAYRALASLPWRGHGTTPAGYVSRARQASSRRRSPRELAVTQLTEATIVARAGQRQESIELFTRARTAFGEMKMAWHVSAVDDHLSGPTVPIPSHSPEPSTARKLTS